MKNKSFSRIKSFFSKIINIRYWFDWDRMKAMTMYLVNGVKMFFSLQKPNKTEAFATAKKRLKITEKELNQRQKGLLRLSIVMVLVAVGIFGYGVYLIWVGGFKGVVVSFVLSLIALTLAFRYHFWYFQIKQRKLGCTFQEWLHQGLLGEKDE